MIDVFVAGSGRTGAPRRLAMLSYAISNIEPNARFIVHKNHEINNYAKELCLDCSYIWKPRVFNENFSKLSFYRKINYLFMIFLFQFYIFYKFLFSRNKIL